MPSPTLLHIILRGESLLLIIELMVFASLAGQEAARICLCLISCAGILHVNYCSGFCVGAGKPEAPVLRLAQNLQNFLSLITST